MAKCIICGDNTTRPIAAAFEHFHLYSPGKWQYWRGNIRMFGFWSGLGSNIGLTFPIYNTLRHWKYRRVSIGVQSR
jgi:hypothetical protein